MADNRAEIVVDGNAQGWRRTMQEVTDSARSGVSNVESSFGRLGGVAEMLQSRFAAITAVFAGGAIFSDAVAKSKEFAEQSLDLGNALGMSATQAGLLKSALAEESVEISTFVGAGQRLSQTLRTNEEALKAVGLSTRDAAGNLRPLNDLTVEAIELVSEYKAGTDRAVAANVLFGKGFELTGDLAKINSELIADVTARQRELGDVVTEESVAAFEAFDRAGKDVTAVLDALQRTIGNAVMPVLADMGNWFVSVGPAAVSVVKVAIGGLAAAFHGLTTGVLVVWETVNAFVYSVAEPLVGVSEAMVMAMEGNFQAAGNRISGISANIDSAWAGAFDRVSAKATQTSERLRALFSSGTELAPVEVTGRTANGLITPDKPQTKKAQEDPSLMQYYEAALAAEKRLVAEKDGLREYTKQQELAFWQTLLQEADLKASDRLAIERKVSDLIVGISRQEAQQRIALDTESARSRDALAMGRIEAERAAAQTALALGQIDKAQMLALEEDFERRRYELQRAALEERLRLLEADPTNNPVELARIKNQLLEIEQQHQIRMGQIQGQQQIEGRSGLFGDIGASFSQNMNSMLIQAQTWQQAMAGVFAGVRDAFLQNVVFRPMQDYIAGLARMLAVKLGFIAQERAAEATAMATSAATVAAKKIEAAGVIPAQAAMAAGGAATAVAGIPIVGPAMAAAAFAETMALVLSGLTVASAAGGYDIPKGINPLTQLHEEEMVLPKSISNPLREMIAGGGAGGGEVPFNLTIQALDARGVERLLLDNRGALVSALRHAAREFRS